MKFSKQDRWFARIYTLRTRLGRVQYRFNKNGEPKNYPRLAVQFGLRIEIRNHEVHLTTTQSDYENGV